MKVRIQEPKVHTVEYGSLEPGNLFRLANDDRPDMVWIVTPHEILSENNVVSVLLRNGAWDYYPADTQVVPLEQVNELVVVPAQTEKVAKP